MTWKPSWTAPMSASNYPKPPVSAKSSGKISPSGAASGHPIISTWANGRENSACRFESIIPWPINSKHIEHRQACSNLQDSSNCQMNKRYHKQGKSLERCYSCSRPVLYYCCQSYGGASSQFCAAATQALISIVPAFAAPLLGILWADSRSLCWRPDARRNASAPVDQPQM